jgi:hypothetical protein
VDSGVYVKIAFDFGGTLNDFPHIEANLRACAEGGHSCYIISATPPDMDVLTYQQSLDYWCKDFKNRNWPVKEIWVTVWRDNFYDIGKDKALLMKQNGIELLFDDEPEVCRAVRDAGLLAFQVK